MWGSYCNIPKAISIYLNGTIGLVLFFRHASIDPSSVCWLQDLDGDQGMPLGINRFRELSSTAMNVEL